MYEDENKIENGIRIIIVGIFIILTVFVSIKYKEHYDNRIKSENYEKMINDYPINSYKGETFITASYPILRDCVLIGDSYAHFVAYDLGFDMTNYSCPGLKLEYLKMVFEAASDCKKKYACIFIGPNDFMSKTPLNDFERYFRGYINQLKSKMGAKVILCTYLPSRLTNKLEETKQCIAKIEEYDAIIKKFTDEANDIFYLDLYTLANKEKYYKTTEGYDDEIHFNKRFNIAFINLLYQKIMKIERESLK